MCGRFALYSAAERLEGQFRLPLPFPIAPRYNIAPVSPCWLSERCAKRARASGPISNGGLCPHGRRTPKSGIDSSTPVRKRWQKSPLSEMPCAIGDALSLLMASMSGESRATGSSPTSFAIGMASCWRWQGCGNIGKAQMAPSCRPARLSPPTRMPSSARCTIGCLLFCPMTPMSEAGANRSASRHATVAKSAASCAR
jgi:hypothetical protein